MMHLLRARALVLQYQARLRLPDTFSHSQKMQCVDHIIEVLDLGACQDTSEYITYIHTHACACMYITMCIYRTARRAMIGRQMFCAFGSVRAIVPPDGPVLFSDITLSELYRPRASSCDATGRRHAVCVCAFYLTRRSFIFYIDLAARAAFSPADAAARRLLGAFSRTSFLLTVRAIGMDLRGLRNAEMN